MEDKRRNAFKAIVAPDKCSVCGHKLFYAGRGSYVCEDCKNVEYDDFGRIDQYLEANGPTSAPVISRALGIPIGKVRELIAQGRLEPIQSADHKGRSLDGEALDKMIHKNDPKRTGTYVGNAGKTDSGQMRFVK